MQHILIPTDFSNNAYNALFYAVKLFKDTTCSFYVLNAYDELTPLRSKSLAKKKLLEQLSDESMEGLEQTLHRIHLDDSNPKHSYVPLSEKGGLLQVISRAVRDRKIDLVVMGNKGATGSAAVFLGSKTTKVLAALKTCPVLAVPADTDFSKPNEIAFATDYKRIFDAEVVHPFRTLASLCSASVRILHVHEEERLDEQQEANLATLLAYLELLPHSIHWMPNFSTKAEAIQAFLDELGIGMLAMVNYPHSFLERLLREPVIKKMVFNISIPFLVIPGKD